VNLSRSSSVLRLAILAGLLANLPAQPVPSSHPLPEAKNWTAAEDHQNMMDQLGVKALRPAPSGNESAPNHANYDEATANPYPNLPDPLTLNNGQKVTTPQMWWTQRRPEIVEDFDREVLGRVPKNVPKVAWTVKNAATDKVGPYAAIGKELAGHVDNSAYPTINVDIEMILVTPAGAKGPVPVMMLFGRGLLPGAPPPPTKGKAGSPASVTGGDPPATQQLLADGWGYAYINPTSVQADNGAGLTRGIIGLVNQGQPRKPDDWGALRAWA